MLRKNQALRAEAADLARGEKAIAALTDRSPPGAADRRPERLQRNQNPERHHDRET
jgi:hypothetical protein